MKKVILIEDNYMYHKIIGDICKKMGIACFPETKDDIETMNSNFVLALTPPGEFEEVFQEEAVKEIQEMLAAYIGDSKDSDVLCICDYQLSENRPKVNGVIFYNKFLGPIRQVLFASATDDPREKADINQCCREGENRIFIPKNHHLKDDITVQITAFSEKEETKSPSPA